MNAIPNQPEMEVITHLPLAKIQPDPNQPRRLFDADELAQFAQFIRADGLIPPILVRHVDDDQHLIIHGERRYRASKMAGRETIPAIIDIRQQGPIDRLIEQVADNLQSELKPMEIAQFYEDLNSIHNVRNADIPKLLKARGLKEPSREQVSAYRRLLKLPKWAQDLINAGTLTPSHGKYILSAHGLDDVMADIRTDVEMDLVAEGRAPTVIDLEDTISQAFNNHYIDIHYPSNQEPRYFDPATCKDCKTCKKLTTRNNGEEVFCLNDDCFEQKQTVAKAQREAGWDIKEPKKAPSPTSPEADNPESYEGHDAVESEQQPEPKATSLQAEALAAGRVEKTQQYLDNWLRYQLARHLAEDQESIFAILLWAAAGAPGNANGYMTGGGLSHPDISHQDGYKHGINLTLKKHIDHGELSLEIVNKALASMTRINLRRLAHHCEIKLEGNYKIDLDYFRLKTKDELINATPTSVRDNWMDADAWRTFCKQPLPKLQEQIFVHADDWGVPDDLLEYYEAQ